MFAERRDRVIKRMEDGVMLLPSARTFIRNRDVEHDWRQDSDFYYLTGFEEPESVGVLAPDRDEPYTLFVRPRDPSREVWDGPRAGVEGAKKHFGADAAFQIGTFEEKLAGLLEGHDRVYYRFGIDREMDRLVLDTVARLRGRIREGITYPTEIVDSGTILHDLRMVKSSDEIERLRKAAEITGAGHVAGIRAGTPGRWEYQVAAAIRFAYRDAGSPRDGYGCIVASGPNACVLHYRDNTRRIGEEELVLVDSGAEWEYYTADISRTWPSGRRFTESQRKVYAVVLEAEKRAIEACAPGKTLDDIHAVALRVLVEGMIDLGWIAGPPEKAIEEKTYQRFYMHRTGHWLGMDVHDVGRVRKQGEPVPFDPGMVFTVEPGLYVPPGSEGIDPAYHGIGVRIEDNIVITPDGYDNLTAGVPKEIEEIESLR